MMEFVQMCPLAKAVAFLLMCCQCLVTSGQALHDTGNEACREPVNVIDMYRNWRGTILESIDLSEVNSPRATRRGSASSEYYDVTITALNMTCHHWQDRHVRSCKCKARDELNFDPNRIPKVMVQSSCCSKNQQMARRSEWMTECREIYHSVQVLRRTGCHAGVYVYSQQWEDIPIGCSCHVIASMFSAS